MDEAKRQKREGQYGADVVSAAIQRLEEGLQVEGFIPSTTFQVRFEVATDRPQHPSHTAGGVPSQTCTPCPAGAASTMPTAAPTQKRSLPSVTTSVGRRGIHVIPAHFSLHRRGARLGHIQLQVVRGGVGRSRAPPLCSQCAWLVCGRRRARGTVRHTPHEMIRQRASGEASTVDGHCC